MKAIVSGRAGVALVLEGESTFLLRAATGLQRIPCHPENFHHLFGDAGDLQFLENVQVSEVATKLGEESRKELALQLGLILLDSGFSLKVRQSAGGELEGLLAQECVEAFVESVFYAHPLPQDTSCAETLSLLPTGTERVRRFLENLGRDQPHIASIHQAWDTVPRRFFRDDVERSQLQFAAVRGGVFREMVRQVAGQGSNPSSLLERWQAFLGGAYPELQPLIREWSTILGSKDDSEASPGPRSSDPLEEAIRKQYERVWLSRELAGAGFARTRAHKRELQKLRDLQTLEAREVDRRLELRFPSPRRRWNRVLAKVERALSV